MSAEENTNTDIKKIQGEVDKLNKRAWEIHITDPEKGLELSSQAKELAQNHTYQVGLAYATRNMGVSHRYLSNLETALSYSVQALSMFEELKDKSGESQALTSIGAIYYYMGEYQQALDYFLQGLHLGEEIGNKESMTYGYNGAGYIYSILGETQKGHDYLEKALELSRDIKNFNLESTILDSIAVSYYNNNEYEKAYETNLITVELCEQKNEKRSLGLAHFGIGNIMLVQGKLEKAKISFLKSLEIHREIGYKSGMADSLLYLGKIYFEEKEFDQAIKYFQESLELGMNIKANATIFKAHQAFSDLYELTKNFELFVHHHKLYYQYKSEVFKEEQENKRNFLSLQYEMEKVKQESEFNRLKNIEMNEKNAELRKKTEELEQSYNSVSVLSRIGQDITSTLNLETILTTVYRSVNELIDATVFGIGIYNPEKNHIEYRMSIEKGKRYQPYKRTMEDKNQFPVWCIENKKEVIINDIEKDYSKYLSNIDMTILSGAEMEDGSAPESPNSLVYIPLMVKDLTIGLLSVQSYRKNAYTTNHLNMLRTLASYTAAALYNAQSFEALDNTLNELKVTQDQLVHAEKMASLGELTAGIAHEIQNPLNFVNNFSEVNTELIEELKAERSKGKASLPARQGERDERLEDDLIEDLAQNTKKINHHGQRASEIVKSMLEHSRTSEGKKESTDINKLADEYLRLAYHGLRAKDKSFNADFNTELDLSLPKVNVIPQEIGRVLLNLINNAFYAVDKKAKSGVADYKPVVVVSTKIMNEKIEISVKDNGDGIPSEIKDKIFQPFFTTKPTGSGTGLGLSLSYDIIKAHGGELSVETKNGEGSEFTIKLPVS